MTVQRSSWFPWVIAAVVTLGVGIAAYNAGVSHGLAFNPNIPATSAWWGGRPWLHPSGFGFPLFPLFFVFFWIFVARALFWRGGWHRHGGRPSAADFDQWHRDAHDRMNRSNL
jgi:hypothetical protein